eukprot:g31964.t1
MSVRRVLLRGAAVRALHGEHLFAHVSDNISSATHLRQLCVWLGVSDEQLAPLFQFATEKWQAARSDAAHLTRGSDSADRSSNSGDSKQPDRAAQDRSGSNDSSSSGSSGSADHSSASDRKQPKRGAQDSGHESREESISQDPRDDARHLIRWCLQLDPKERPTVLQVLRHRFLDPKNGEPHQPSRSWNGRSSLASCALARCE